MDEIATDILPEFDPSSLLAHMLEHRSESPLLPYIYPKRKPQRVIQVDKCIALSDQTLERNLVDTTNIMKNPKVVEREQSKARAEKALSTPNIDGLCEGLLRVWSRYTTVTPRKHPLRLYPKIQTDKEKENIEIMSDNIQAVIDIPEQLTNITKRDPDFVKITRRMFDNVEDAEIQQLFENYQSEGSALSDIGENLVLVVDPWPDSATSEARYDHNIKEAVTPSVPSIQNVDSGEPRKQVTPVIVGTSRANLLGKLDVSGYKLLRYLEQCRETIPIGVPMNFGQIFAGCSRKIAARAFSLLLLLQYKQRLQITQREPYSAILFHLIDKNKL